MNAMALAVPGPPSFRARWHLESTFHLTAEPDIRAVAVGSFPAESARQPRAKRLAGRQGCMCGGSYEWLL